MPSGLLYSLSQLRRENTWLAFRERATDAAWPVALALLWMGAFALYGMSSVLLGSLGTSLGWDLFQIFMIMTANLSGLLTHEWSGAPRRSGSASRGSLRTFRRHLPAFNRQFLRACLMSRIQRASGKR